MQGWLEEDVPSNEHVCLEDQAVFVTVDHILGRITIVYYDHTLGSSVQLDADKHQQTTMKNA